MTAKRATDRQPSKSAARVAAGLWFLICSLALAAGCGGSEPDSIEDGDRGDTAELAAQLAALLEQQEAQQLSFQVLGCQVDGESLALVAELLLDGRVQVSTAAPAGVAGYAPSLDELYWPSGQLSADAAQNVVHEAVHVLQDYHLLSVTSAQSEVPAYLAQLLYEIGRAAGRDPERRQIYVSALQEHYTAPQSPFEQIIAAALGVVADNQELLALQPTMLSDAEVQELLTAISASPDYQAQANDWVPTDGVAQP